MVDTSGHASRGLTVCVDRIDISFSQCVFQWKIVTRVWRVFKHISWIVKWCWGYFYHYYIYLLFGHPFPLTISCGPWELLGYISSFLFKPSFLSYAFFKMLSEFYENSNNHLYIDLLTITKKNSLLNDILKIENKS